MRLATILGTLQSTLTNFRFLRKGWTDNCVEERLLGVSFTGIYDCPALRNATADDLIGMKHEAIATNQKWAKVLDIAESAAITCVKPSGTVSQLCDSGSGIHPRWGKHYIRRVRNDKKDPISNALMEAGVPHEEDKYNAEAWVFSFPVKAPSKALTRHDVTPIGQLELWKHFALNWCEHKPSMTCYVPEDSWAEVAAWIWKNWDIVNGISFLPSADEGHIYDQAPYEDLDLDGYKEMKKGFPTTVDWKSIVEYQDATTASQELACVGDHCEI